MMLTRNAAIVSVVGLLIALTGPADAARPNAKAKHNQMVTINGMVVHHKGGKPVAGAHVHVVHHKHAAAAGAAMPKMAKMRAVQPKAARANVHHGTMTGANGAFTMKHHHTGTITLVAHKKNVGTGHAKVAVGNGQAANVMIRIHKHHHHHA